jgi:hypothetical protein
MAKPKRQVAGPRAPVTYDEAFEILDRVLGGSARVEIVNALVPDNGDDCSAALARLRGGMRSHTFRTAAGPVALERLVRALDQRTCAEGFHVLESWDYRQHRFAADIAPVLLLDRCAATGLPDARHALSVLLDQYFLSVVSLLAVRAWDEGDANANLDRVTRLLGTLQGPGGSGQRFVDDAASLLMLAISHYHPQEQAYDVLLRKIWSLDERHQLGVAAACAATLGGHLRWGFRFMYQRDVGLMRSDNVVDYPWLLWSTLTLLRAYAKPGDTERDAVAECLVHALSVDPWLFDGKPPAALEAFAGEHAEACDHVNAHRDALLGAFANHRPRALAYSPLSFTCNFLCNASVAMAATAVADPAPHPSLNALFTRQSPQSPQDFPPEAVARYATALMTYARGGVNNGQASLIVYDPLEAEHSFNMTMQVLSAGRIRAGPFTQR